MNRLTKSLLGSLILAIGGFAQATTITQTSNTLSLGTQEQTVDGQDLSLDDIEHGILRGLWKDPHIHYGVNCASVGCPNLQPQPFTGKTVDDQLTQAAIAYVNDPRGVRVIEKRVRVSSIYSWFKEDFGNSDQGVLDHLKTYADENLKADLSMFSRINGYDYDWSLNDATE